MTLADARLAGARVKMGGACKFARASKTHTAFASPDIRVRVVLCVQAVSLSQFEL